MSFISRRPSNTDTSITKNPMSDVRHLLRVG
jgi:hypothetical protein